MAKKPIRRIGIVGIKEGTAPKTGRPYVELRYRDPSSGLEVKRRVSGDSHAEARAMAENLTREAYRGRGYLPDRQMVPTLEAGIAEALRLSDCREYVRRDRAWNGARFVKWMSERYPAVKDWSQIKPGMVRAFKQELEREGKAYDTVRLGLAVVKLAWKRMAEDHPGQVVPLPSIQIKRQEKAAPTCLDARSVAALLDWARGNAPDVWPIIALEALTGLRQMEVTALRRCDVDLEAGILTVTKTPLHEPKSRQSYRTVPLCGEALEALRRAAEAQRVVPPGGELFTNALGNTWRKDALAGRFAKLRKRAAIDTKMPALEKAKLKRLRASFGTMASLLEIPERLIKSYMGHAPGDVFGAHYRAILPDELRTVSSRMDGWRNLASEGEARKESGNSSDVRIAEA